VEVESMTAPCNARDDREPTPYSPRLGGIMATLTCHREVTDGHCGAPAVWHLSWYDEQLPAGEWENSLACQSHRDEADQLWQIGWRHRVLPACALPGSRLVIADEGDDEDGFPLTFCYHPFDAEAVATEAEQVTQEATRAV
jgi:hypothetical protein